MKESGEEIITSFCPGIGKLEEMTANEDGWNPKRVNGVLLNRDRMEF